MQDDSIAVALGLPQLRTLKQKELEGHFEVAVIYRRDKAICPRCGKVTTKEHDRRAQCKQDRRLRDKVVFLTLKKRFLSQVFPEPVAWPSLGAENLIRLCHHFRRYRGNYLRINPRGCFCSTPTICLPTIGSTARYNDLRTGSKDICPLALALTPTFPELQWQGKRKESGNSSNSRAESKRR